MNLRRQVLSPVFFKEVVQMSTRRGAFVSRCLFLGILLLIVTFVLLAQDDYVLLADTSRVGAELFGALTAVELVAILALTPMATAGCIAGEREADTLGLLFLTRLNAWNIVQDKALARISHVLVLCVLTFPFMTGALLFGGVSTAQLVHVMMTLLGTVLACGGVTVLCSTLAARYVNAVSISYAAIVGLLFLPPLVLELLVPFAPRTFAAGLNPVLALEGVWNSFAWPGTIGPAYWRPFLRNCVLLYLGTTLAAALVLRRVRARDGSGTAAPGRWRQLLRQLDGIAISPLTLFDHRGRLRGHPVFWQAAGIKQNTAKAICYRLTAVGVILTLGLTVWGTAVEDPTLITQSEFYLTLFSLAAGAAYLMTMLIAAASFTGERHRRTLDLLLTTRLPGRAIARQTLAANARSVLPLWLLPLATLAFGDWASADRWLELYVLPNLFFIPFHAAFLLVLGTFLSLTSKTSARALAKTLTIMLTLTAGSFVIAIMIDELADIDDDLLLFVLGIFNPGLWIIGGVIDDGVEEFGRTPALWMSLVLHLILFGSAMVWLYTVMTRGFNHLTSRQPE